jgi:hypothetical protein
MAHQVRDPYLRLIPAETDVLYSTDKDMAKDTAKGKDMDKGTDKVKVRDKVKDKDLLVTVVIPVDSLTHRLLALLPVPILCYGNASPMWTPTGLDTSASMSSKRR